MVTPTSKAITCLTFCHGSWLLSDSAINMTSKSRKARMPSTKDLWWQWYQRWSNLSFIMLPSPPRITHVLTLFHSGLSLATSTSLSSTPFLDPQSAPPIFWEACLNWGMATPTCVLKRLLGPQHWHLTPMGRLPCCKFGEFVSPSFAASFALWSFRSSWCHPEIELCKYCELGLSDMLGRVLQAASSGRINYLSVLSLSRQNPALLTQMTPLRAVSFTSRSRWELAKEVSSPNEQKALHYMHVLLLEVRQRRENGSACKDDWLKLIKIQYQYYYCHVYGRKIP